MTSASKDPPVVIMVGGGIGSGKTTVAGLLSEMLGCPGGSFGEVVRSVARSRRLSASRESLQKIGKELVEERPQEFCRLVLDLAGWREVGSLVIEGLRHAELLTIIKDLVAPTCLVFVFLDVTPMVRSDRVIARGDKSSDINILDRHATESQVQAHLRDVADLVLDGSQDVDRTCKLILEHAARIACSTR